jgi:hypothetical protein
VQLWNDGCKIVSIGAQAMKPDDRSGGVGAGFDFDTRKHENIREIVKK